jgi:hypothetical protein
MESRDEECHCISIDMGKGGIESVDSWCTKDSH